MAEHHDPHVAGPVHEPAGHAAHTHEKTDADVGAIVKFGFWLAVGVVVAVGAGALIFWALARETRPEPPPSALAGPQQPPPAPRLQVNPYGDLEMLREREQKALRSYGWVDKNAA
jgi:hypothetical protein